jgi:hypothetical protein
VAYRPKKGGNKFMGISKKRGPKPKGGIRIILRLLPDLITALDEEQKRSGRTRTDLIQRAIEAQYLGKRRKTDWEPPKR